MKVWDIKYATKDFEKEIIHRTLNKSNYQFSDVKQKFHGLVMLAYSTSLHKLVTS